MQADLEIREIETRKGGVALVATASFDATTFDIAHFAAEGIRCPLSVARSSRNRQAEFFFGRLTARAALEALGEETVDILIGALRQPLWPEGVVGSISHTDSAAAAIVGMRSDHAGLGIDIENVVPEEVCAVIKDVVLDEGELACLGRQAPFESMRRLVTLALSAKESFFKGTFDMVGSHFDLHTARLTAIHPQKNSVVLQVESDLHPLLLRGMRYEVTYSWLTPRTLLTVFDQRLTS